MAEPAHEPDKQPRDWKAHFEARAVSLGIVAVLGAFSALGHFAFGPPRPFNQTAALYVGVPLLIALAVAAFMPRSQTKAVASIKWTTVLLALSIPIVKEGFLCVIFAAPIFYTIAALVGAIFDWIEIRRSKRGPLEAMALLSIIAMSSLEGIAPALTVDRSTMITVERTIAASRAEVEAQLTAPMRRDRPQSRLLRIFPMPVAIEGQGAATGDERRLVFVYAKWIWWNMHTGETRFRIERPSADHIRYVPLTDTSYLSGYLGWRAIDLHLETVDAGTTRARLEIAWERRLDPAWYFGPLQHAAVRRAAETLIDNGIVPMAEMKR